MKVLITESQLNNAIERLIKSINKNVVSVDFVEKRQAHVDDKIKGISYYDKTIITVVLDPHDILGGNLHTGFSVYDYIPLRKEIKNALKNFLNINTDLYMAPYDIEFYVITLTRV